MVGLIASVGGGDALVKTEGSTSTLIHRPASVRWPASSIVPGRLSFLGAGIRSYISDDGLPAIIDVDALDTDALLTPVS